MESSRVLVFLTMVVVEALTVVLSAVLIVPLLFTEEMLPPMVTELLVR